MIGCWRWLSWLRCHVEERVDWGQTWSGGVFWWLMVRFGFWWRFREVFSCWDFCVWGWCYWWWVVFRRSRGCWVQWQFKWEASHHERVFQHQYLDRRWAWRRCHRAGIRGRYGEGTCLIWGRDRWCWEWRTGGFRRLFRRRPSWQTWWVCRVGSWGGRLIV